MRGSVVVQATGGAGRNAVTHLRDRRRARPSRLRDPPTSKRLTYCYTNWLVCVHFPTVVSVSKKEYSMTQRQSALTALALTGGVSVASFLG